MIFFFIVPTVIEILLVIAMALYIKRLRRSSTVNPRGKAIRANVLTVVGTIISMHIVYVSAKPSHSLFMNPLISDAELIAFYEKNKIDLNDIANIERNYNRYNPSSIDKMNKQREQEILRKLCVYAPSENGYWPENPYSVEAIKAEDKILQSLPNIERFLYHDRRQALEVTFKQECGGWYKASLRYPGNLLRKYLINIPATVDTSNNTLKFPMFSETHVREERLFNSLSGYPPSWQENECVNRQIDLHWFIVMCRIRP